MTAAPECAAGYGPGEEECDGDPRGANPSCAWREPCRRLALFCRTTGFNPEILQECTLEDLERLAKAVDDTGRISGTVADVLAPQDKAKPARSHRFSERMWRLHLHFENHLRDRFGAERVRNSMHEEKQDQVILRPGSFFPVDRSERSGYVVWYCKTGERYDRPLFVVYFRPKLGCVDLHLPVSIEKLEERFSRETLRRLSPAPVVDGWFVTLCKGLKEEGIGLAVGAMKKLVDRGDYEIPEVW